jgi:hypothetical protein
MLRAEGFALGFVGPLRALLLVGAAAWSGPCLDNCEPLYHLHLASLRGDFLRRSCRFNGVSELGPFILGLAVTGPYSYFG